MTQLEARENPATPVGLTDFSSLLGTYGYSPGFSETHNIGRSETKSVTVDQVGSGSTGTFTVTIDATSSATDTASGSSSGNGYGSSISATGSLSEQAVAHQAISGSYSNGTFTITGMTYTETGSWSVAQSTTTAYPQMSSQQRRDTNSTSNYALSWSAAVGTYGQLEYTSYDYTAAETGHDRWRSDWSSPNGSGYSDFITDTAYTVHTTGSGWLATVTGTDTATSTMAGAYTNPDGTGYSYSNTYTQTNPVPSTVYLGMPYQSTSGWTWKAGTPNAINFSFHGVATDNSTLTESLTATSGYGGTTIDVNSFASTSHATDSGHVVNDEPGTPASGTELYHRDELFASATDVTGSGSYISGSANADYQLGGTTSYAVANRFDVRDALSSGFDDEGEAYTQSSNYSTVDEGSGTRTDASDYHDGGTGLELTGGTYGYVGASTFNTRMWGTRNGEGFDIPNSRSESFNESNTLPGNANSGEVAGDLADTAPMRARMFLPKALFCQVPAPRQPLPKQPMNNEMRQGNILDGMGRAPGNPAVKQRFNVTVSIYYNKDKFTELKVGQNNEIPIPLNASTTGEANRLLNEAVGSLSNTVSPKVRVEFIAVKDAKALAVIKKGQVNKDEKWNQSTSERWSLYISSPWRNVKSIFVRDVPFLPAQLNTSTTFNFTMELKAGAAPAGGGALGSGEDFSITLYLEGLRNELGNRTGADVVSLISVDIVHEMMHGFGLDHNDDATLYVDSPTPSATTIFGRTIRISSAGAANLFDKMKIPK